ncbi:MAG: hypothetical protein EDM77_03720 [Candidatus Jettenia sp. AMX1]|nr:hypothetical protein [Candidatus Jettenia sp. AMX1]MCQ3926752.1 hypothetical protein [Candidatus Jettenia sp.]GJQ44271.1 MAG: hypothetical protein JETCAE04_00250 [Candidatus Jettenia caeni]KAA0250636.1 MAG: hypothetical protein EDM77_03720 [Candidatus Jettenia sp. AMX1]MCE7879970.1 hypothetical protein [Candidatus Jettenia sp. AMX1]MDL1938489.1 hypothetical protein [Candidatus Jettenia sp. AMX1]
MLEEEKNSSNSLNSSSGLNSGTSDIQPHANNQSGLNYLSNEEEVGIPERLRVKRRYTKSENYMSDAAREARSKGGKARAEKFPAPNWKHGKYAKSFVTGAIKPCKSTCPQYPCDIIEEGKTTPGDACLDKAAVIETYKAIIDAVKHKKLDDFQEIASLTIAQSIQTLQMLLEDVIRDGPTIQSEVFDKHGTVIGHEMKHHPALNVLPKLIADLGMSPQEFMITPKAIAKQGTEEKGIETLGDLLSKIGSNMQKKEAKKDEE